MAEIEEFLKIHYNGLNFIKKNEFVINKQD